MASGDELWVWRAGDFRFDGTTGFPGVDVVGDLEHEVLVFDQTTDEIAYIDDVVPPQYAGGGITVKVFGVAVTGTTGVARLGFEMNDVVNGTTDLDSNAVSGGTERNADWTAPASANIVQIATISLSHADIGSPSSGQMVCASIKRDADGTTGTDDLAGDWGLLMIQVTET